MASGQPVPLPRQKNLRADTAWVIFQILENGKSSRECLAKVQRRHHGKDNAWILSFPPGFGTSGISALRISKETHVRNGFLI